MSQPTCATQVRPWYDIFATWVPDDPCGNSRPWWEFTYYEGSGP